MYRRSKFLELLIQIRQDMARAADYDTDLFVERARSQSKRQKVAEDDSRTTPDEVDDILQDDETLA